MLIGTKAQAERVMIESLFKPVNGRTLERVKWCNGKYKPGSYVGRDVDVPAHVHALYTVTQRDSDGPYVRIMAIVEASA